MSVHNTQAAWGGYPLHDIQANILLPHGRQHVRLLFLRFPQANIRLEFRKWLRQFLESEDLTSAARQYEDRLTRRTYDPEHDGKLVLSLLLSRHIYEDLGLPEGRWPNDPFFRSGMGSGFSQEALRDVPSREWEPDLAKDYHVLLILADDQPARLALRCEAIETLSAEYTDPRSRHWETGYKLMHNGREVEHFGYRDGISQIPFWEEGLRLRTENLPLALAAEGNGRYGSYLVYRKLEQKVATFHEEIARIAGLTGQPVGKIGAQVFGRYKTGRPLVFDYGQAWNDQYFDYSNDPHGRICPFHAHIRKANPRDPRQFSHRHLIIRRGVAYGKRDPNLADRPDEGVGLQFLSYQASIADQFAYIQKNWLNNPHYPENRVREVPGIDPLVGRHAAPAGESDSQKWPRSDRGQFAQLFSEVVRFRGGGYYYAPSISFLREQAGLLTPAGPVPQQFVSKENPDPAKYGSKNTLYVSLYAAKSWTSRQARRHSP